MTTDPDPDQLAKELQQILDAREMLGWDDLPQFIKDDWRRVADHVVRREKILYGIMIHPEQEGPNE